MTEQKPPFGTFLLVTMICYIVANGFTILLILSSKLFLYAVAILHVFIKRRSVHTKYVATVFFLPRPSLCFFFAKCADTSDFTGSDQGLLVLVLKLLTIFGIGVNSRTTIVVKKNLELPWLVII
jgi:hypothetical protein